MPLDDLPPPQDAAAAPAPADPAAAAAAPAPDAGALPSPFADVVSGSIPAVLIPAIPAHGKPDPVQEFAANRFGDLLQAGLDYHETKDQSVVLFNPKVISAEKVAAADRDGTLGKIAQPVDDIAAPGAAPAPDAAAAPVPDAAPAADAGPLSAAPAPMPMASAGGPPPPGVQRMRSAALAPRKVSPIMPNPIPDQLARRAV